MSDIHSTAVVDPKSRIAADAEIGPYCVIGPDVTIKSGTKLMSHVVVDGHTTIGAGCTVFPFASLGTRTQDLKYQGAETFVEIGDGTTIREYVTVNAGTTEAEITRVGSQCLVMAYSHVAHGCRVGDQAVMANCATLAGHVEVEDQAIIGGLVAIHQFCRVGRLCIIGGCSRITQDCAPFMLVVGNPAATRGVNSVGLRRRSVDETVQKRLKRAYRILYRERLATKEALDKIRAELEMGPELEHLVQFVEQSERGIVR